MHDKYKLCKMPHAGTLGVASILALSVSSGAVANTTENAEQQDNPALEKIVVTARKREEWANNVPASLNVFSGDNLESKGITNLADMQYQTPGLKVAVGSNSTRIALRGVGTNIPSGGPSVAVHMDGIYVPNVRFALAEMFDVGRVEVLKGPEGTLYGRNATGGAINIVSAAPGDEFSADGYVGYGSYNLITAQAGLTLPVSDNGGLRLSGVYANDDGYTDNINSVGGEIDDRNFRGGRIRGQFELSDVISTDFSVQYSRDKGTVGFGVSNNPDSPVYASIAPQRQDERNINVDQPPMFDQEGVLLSGTLTFELGSVTLKSLTGYIDYDYTETSEVDGSGGFIAINETMASSEFFSQEFQLSGAFDNGIFWTAGLYYSDEKFGGRGTETDNDYPLNDPYIYTDQILDRETTSQAVFGEITVPLTERLSLVSGARYTKEKWRGASSLDAPLFIPAPIETSAETEADSFTPKVLLDYQLDVDEKVYASITQGFKSGGANLAIEADIFEPESIWAYELGYKASTENGRGAYSLAGFYYDYTDLQLRTLLFTEAGIITEITNAAKASIYGIEAAFAYSPVDGLRFDFNGAYLDTELKNFISPVTEEEVVGLPLPLTPEWSFTAGIEKDFNIGDAGRLKARIETAYQSEVNFPQFADFERERQAGYSLVSANIRYDAPGDKLYVALIGRNLTDTLYKTQRFYYEGFADNEYYGAPRMVELRVGYKW